MDNIININDRRKEPRTKVSELKHQAMYTAGRILNRFSDPAPLTPGEIAGYQNMLTNLLEIAQEE